jgi:hypothetical protein
MAPAQPGVITSGLFSLGPRWLAFASREPAPPTIVSPSHSSSCALPHVNIPFFMSFIPLLCSALQDARGSASGAAGEFNMKRVVTLAQRTGANLYHFGEQTVSGLFSSGGHSKPVCAS